MKLRTYMALMFAIMVVVLTVSLSYAIGRQTTNLLRKEIGNSLAETSNQSVDKLDRFMWSRFKEVKLLSNLNEVKTQPGSAQPLLDQVKKEIPVFSWMAIADLNGKVLSATDGLLTGKDISTRPVFQKGIKGDFIGDVHDAVLLAKHFPTDENGEPVKFVDISMPIVQDDGIVTGVLASHLSWEWSKEVTQGVIHPLKGKYPGVEIFLISKENDTVVIGPDDWVGKSFNGSWLKEKLVNRTGSFVQKWSDGQDYLTGYAMDQGYQDYPGLGWTLMIRQPIDEAFMEVEQLKTTILLMGLVAAVIFAIIGWYVSARITKPLHRISTYADRLRAGDAVQMPVYNGVKEIEVLALSLRDLVQSLVSTTSRLGTMETLAQRDQLTGLYNRLAFEQIITDMDLHRKESETYIVLYLDLDGFKQVNDTYGHHVGDLLLQHVAQRLKNSMRTHEMVFRMGGDEFVAILQAGSEPVKEGTVVGTRFIEALSAPFFIEGETITVGCSVGGSVWPEDDMSLNQVVRYADECLYDVKRSGKNRVSFYQKR